MDYRVSLVGLLIGFLVGLTGMGGGALLTPIMILFFKVPPVFAVGVDFVYSTIMKGVGTMIHIRHKQVNFKIAWYLSRGSIPGVLLSSILIHVFLKSHGNLINNLISHSIGVVLLLAAFFLLCKPFLLRRVKTLSTAKGLIPVFLTFRPLIVSCLGFLIGFIIGMTSIGSGSLILVCLTLIYPRLSAKELVGTDIFQALLLLFAGSVVYIAASSINWHLVFLLLIGALPGVIIGSLVTKRIPDAFLRPMLALLLIITGIKLLL